MTYPPNPRSNFISPVIHLYYYIKSTILIFVFVVVVVGGGGGVVVIDGSECGQDRTRFGLFAVRQNAAYIQYSIVLNITIHSLIPCSYFCFCQLCTPQIRWREFLVFREKVVCSYLRYASVASVCGLLLLPCCPLILLLRNRYRKLPVVIGRGLTPVNFLIRLWLQNFVPCVSPQPLVRVLTRD